jgi:exonuclease VII large subunit
MKTNETKSEFLLHASKFFNNVVKTTLINQRLQYAVNQMRMACIEQKLNAEHTRREQNMKAFDLKSNKIFYKLGLASLLISVNNLKKNFKACAMSKIQSKVILMTSNEFSSMQTPGTNQTATSNEFFVSDPMNPSTGKIGQGNSLERVKEKDHESDVELEEPKIAEFSTNVATLDKSALCKKSKVCKDLKSRKKGYSSKDIIPGGFGLSYKDRKRIKLGVMNQFKETHNLDTD